MVIIISYNKQTWNEYNDNQTAAKNLANGAIISADKLNHMETGISNNDTNKVTDNKNGTIEVNGSSITPADNSKVVHSTDMRKPAYDVAGIEEVSAKQDKISYTPADDSKVVHNSGNEEIAGQKTFDIAPIDKTTGNPYITKDDVPAVPSTLADTTKDANFTGKLQKSGIDVATKSDVSNAVNTATSNFSKFIEASKNDKDSAISDSTKGNSDAIYYWTKD